MNAKEYLKQIQECDRKIENKLSMIQSLYDRCFSVTSVIKDMPGGGGSGDTLGNAISKIVDLREEVNAEVDRFVDLKREALIVIQHLDSAQAYVMYKRYFEYKPWEQISVELGYTFRHVIRLHGEALKKLNHVLQCP